MIETVVLDFLMQRLPYPVHMEIPPKPPARYYILRKANTERTDLIDTAMFTVLSYAESLLEAAKMNELAKTAMDELTELDAVSESSRGGDYPFPDTKTKQPRYQTVHNITHY